MSEAQKKQLEAQLWNIADTLRGKMDADEFRDYILGFIFYKYLSEKMEDYANEILAEDGVSYFDIIGTADEADYIEAIQEEAIEKLGYFLRPEELFSEVAKRGANSFILEDLTSILRSIEHTTMGTESEDDFVHLFEDLDLTSTKLGKTVEARNKLIVQVLVHLNNINFELKNHDRDVLGDAYEYLIGQFAAGAGKKAGEFYTPQQVSKILAKLVTVGKTKLKSVYDPTCGSGSLLLRVAKEVNEVSNFYGQELNRTTYNLARMNMIMHDVHYRKFDLKQDDTLEHPQHIDQRFEAIVANPPFSSKWSANPLFMNDDRFSKYGKLPPSKPADYAFIQHMIYHLDEDGVMAVVLPHGALFRAKAEGLIRKILIEERNYLDGIIGLPENLFFGTDKAFCILIFKKCRENPNDVIFIDASKEFIRGDSKNLITDGMIDNIINAYVKRSDSEGYAHRATLNEIQKNDYFLNIARYVKDTKSHDLQDLNNISKMILSNKEKIIECDNEIETVCTELAISNPYDKHLMSSIFENKIRFHDDMGKPFPDWRNYKLSELLTEHKTRNSDNQYQEVFSVAKGKGVVNQIEHLGRSYASENLTTYKVVFPDDLVYTKSPTSDFPFGIIKANKTGRTGVVSVLYAVFSPSSKNIGILIDYYFSSWVNTYNYLSPIISKGVKNTININNDVFLNGDYIYLPQSEKEIDKIVNFLNLIDRKISLLEDQLKLHEEYKNSAMHSAFRQDYL